MSPGRCVLAFTVIGVFSTALRISPLGRLRQPFIHPATPRQPNGPPTRTTAPTSALSRRDFPALNRPNPPDLIYFDNAATTQKPTPVIEAITAYYSTPCANVHRSQHSLAASASSRYESARQNLARFLRASSSSEIVFTSGATESINLVANSWCIDNVGPRDVIVLPLSEHNSNIIPWQLHAERSGCRVSFLQLTPDGSIDLDDYKRHLSLARVKLVSLAHASNVLGRVQDLAPLIRLAHEHGAKVLVDACQTLAHIPVNVTELDCDFLVGSAHKMYGPTGIGFLYAKRSVLESMRPWKGGGGTVKSVDTFGFESEDIPQRFESGTPPVAQALGFSAAVDFLRATGLQKITTHERDLLHHLHAGLSDVATIYSPSPGTAATPLCPIVSFNVESISPFDLAALLATRNVAVRAGQHCAHVLHREHLKVDHTLRVSLAMYNTTTEIDQFLGHLAEAVASLRAASAR